MPKFLGGTIFVVKYRFDDTKMDARANGMYDPQMQKLHKNSTYAMYLVTSNKRQTAFKLTLLKSNHATGSVHHPIQLYMNIVVAGFPNEHYSSGNLTFKAAAWHEIVRELTRVQVNEGDVSNYTGAVYAFKVMDAGNIFGTLGEKLANE